MRTARRTDPLGIPALEAAQLNALFDHFQPRFLVQTQGDFDRVGQPVWRNGALAVDLRDPLHYRLSSYTRFGDTVLLQLNYVIWFPRRPPTSRGDIYAGELDGLIWRVTLDSEGRVFAYDSIHPCGCYHKLYPVVGGARLRPLDPSQEQPLVYPPLDSLAQPLVVIASGHHYVLAAGDPENWLPREPGRAAVRVSTGLPYESLLSMPAGTGRRSLFGRDGLVAGSERPERFVLWPMGILSPGAMRVWGTHAISFTGRRHFDGARLLEEFFWLREPGSGGADG